MLMNWVTEILSENLGCGKRDVRCHLLDRWEGPHLMIDGKPKDFSKKVNKMPYMCNIQMPKGKPKEVIEKTMVEISEIMIRNFDAKPRAGPGHRGRTPPEPVYRGRSQTAEMPEFEEKKPMEKALEE